MRALVGCTGTIGKNLLNQIIFDKIYHSKNILEIVDKEFNELYLCCLPATKWLINKNPESDNDNTNKIINILKTVNAKFVVLISTIDVYPIKNNKSNEDSLIDNTLNDIYGKNRYLFEIFVKKTFSNYLIVRLPGLFGDYLKKNIIYDLINDNNIDKIAKYSEFQWYFLDNLSDDINKCRSLNISLINLFTEPISNIEIIDYFFKQKSQYIVCDSNNTYYDLHSKYASNGYWYNKLEVMEHMGQYLKRVRTNIALHDTKLNNIVFSNLAWDINENSRAIEILLENGIDKVELVLTKFFTWNELNDDKIRYIKNIFNEKQIQIYALQAITYGLDYNLFDDTGDLLLEHIKKVIYYAHILECKLIVFGSPRNRSHKENYDENIALSFFKQLNETANKYNIIVCIEPNARVYNCNFLWNLEQTFNFVKKLDLSHIKMMADTGCMSFESDNIQYIQKYSNYIHHIHLSEQYLEILTNKHTNHRELSTILLDIKKGPLTIEMKSNNSNNNTNSNINRLYKTICFIKENYYDYIIANCRNKYI